MKRTIIAILALAIITTGSVFIFAQKGDDAKHRGPGKDRQGREFGRMFKHLELTDEQKTQAKALFSASREKTSSLREASKANRSKMRELTANGGFDEAQIVALANEQAAVEAQVTVERLRVRSQMYNLLTPEQKAKAEEMKNSFKEKRKGRFERFKKERAAPAPESE